MCKFKGLPLHVSDSAMQELCREDATLIDIIRILNEGYDAPRKRKTGCIERWMDKGNKTYNAVVIKDYHMHLKQECYLLIHFGKFTRK